MGLRGDPPVVWLGGRVRRLGRLFVTGRGTWRGWVGPLRRPAGWPSVKGVIVAGNVEAIHGSSVRCDRWESLWTERSILKVGALVSTA